MLQVLARGWARSWESCSLSLSSRAVHSVYNNTTAASERAHTQRQSRTTTAGATLFLSLCSRGQREIEDSVYMCVYIQHRWWLPVSLSLSLNLYSAASLSLWTGLTFGTPAYIPKSEKDLRERYDIRSFSCAVWWTHNRSPRFPCALELRAASAYITRWRRPVRLQCRSRARAAIFQSWGFTIVACLWISRHSAGVGITGFSRTLARFWSLYTSAFVRNVYVCVTRDNCTSIRLRVNVNSKWLCKSKSLCNQNLRQETSIARQQYQRATCVIYCSFFI